MLALAGLATCVSVCCSRRGPPVATLIETQGSVERNDGAAAWTNAGPGVAFVVGDALRTRAKAQARFRLTNGAVIRVLENARVRFARGTLSTGRGPDLSVELGTAEVEATTEDQAIVTALGVARIERGARVRVSSDGERSTLEVVVGRAVVLGAAGDLIVDEGQGARIKPGDAQPERYRVQFGAPIVETAPSPPAAAAPVVPPAPEPPAVLPPEDKPVRVQSARADVTLDAGDSGTVHVAGPSLSLRLVFDRLCPGEGTLEVKDRHQVRAGSGAVVLKLRPGTLRYRLRCVGDARTAQPRASGALTVKRDSGDIPVSRRAAVNVLDADGRRYTVLYQTRLPALTLGWTAAPAGAPDLSLHIQSSAGVQMFPSPTARKQLSSGTLPEGSYLWWYATADGRASPKTAVNIRFDNAAPTAQFFPAHSGAEVPEAGMVSVDGVTIDGAKVSAGGRSLPIDGRGRFSATVAPLSGDDAVIVRLEHPRTGIHYYVRQAGLRRHHGKLAHAR
jgi:hypothetical protein